MNRIIFKGVKEINIDFLVLRARPDEIDVYKNGEYHSTCESYSWNGCNVWCDVYPALNGELKYTWHIDKED